MKEGQPRRIPDNMVKISISRNQEGGAVVNLAMNETTFEPFRRAAQNRGMGIEEVIGEAIRLELLWNEIRNDPNRDLIIFKGFSFLGSPKMEVLVSI